MGLIYIGGAFLIGRNFFGMIALLFNFLKIVWKIYCDVVLRKDELLIIDGDEKDENVA